MSTIAGIDYSLTNPSICIHDSENDGEFSIDNCKFFFLTQTKKFAGQFLAKRITGGFVDTSAFSCQEERHHELSNYFMDVLEGFDCQEVAIEDYAFAAKGQVFNIGENTGLLKFKLWTEDYIVHKYAPTQIKKFATGKGTAKKEHMIAAFEKETGIDLYQQLRAVSKKPISPISDIVDSFYICQYHFYSGVAPQNKDK